jgi:hypothetical protein
VEDPVHRLLTAGRRKGRSGTPRCRCSNRSPTGRSSPWRKSMAPATCRSTRR